MTHLEKLRNARTKRDLAQLLGFKYKAMTYLVYEMSEGDKYTAFEIGKKSGGTRQIFAPNEKLKLLQRRLADILLACDSEINKEKFTNTRGRQAVSHGFKKGFSIMSNADQHIGKRYVLNIDLENFFPSFNFGRVRGFFLKDKNFLLSPPVATAIAQIACHQNHLPQGSPCSPVISNLISRYLDIKLVHFAKLNGCSYTRYADDISISTNQKNIPKTIAHNRTLLILHKWVLGRDLKKIVRESGFNINKNKTRVQHRAYRQEVTGLIVNKQVNVKKEYYRSVRAMCNSLFQTGQYFFPTEAIKKEYAEDKTLSTIKFKFFSFLKRRKVTKEFNTVELSDGFLQGSLDRIEGRLNYIYQVKKIRNKYAKPGYRQNAHHVRNIEKKEDVTSSMQLAHHRSNSFSDENHIKSIEGIKNLYSRFLFYKNFYTPAKSVIVCEGKTDYVYLECAYNQLKEEFPSLSREKDGSESSEREKLFKFLKVTKKNIELMFHDGGTSNIFHLLNNYKHSLKYFKSAHKEPQKPVIVILDNDGAGKNVLKKYCQEYESGKITYHLFKNVYAIIMPEDVSGGDRPIEYLFDKKILDTKVKDKTLCLKNKGCNSDREYGKHIFAEKVIKPKQKEINFDRFKPVLGAVERLVSGDYIAH